MPEVHVLGRGRLGWQGAERRTDRYGMLGLFAGWSDLQTVSLAVDGFVGKKGKLRAVILEARESRHIGDLFLGVGPRPVKAGDVIELGVGTVATEDSEAGMRIGVLPEDGRETFWLHPQHLYDCHDQTVRLEFVEGDLDMEPWIEDDET